MEAGKSQSESQAGGTHRQSEDCCQAARHARGPPLSELGGQYASSIEGSERSENQGSARRTNGGRTRRVRTQDGRPIETRRKKETVGDDAAGDAAKRQLGRAFLWSRRQAAAAEGQVGQADPLRPHRRGVGRTGTKNCHSGKKDCGQGAPSSPAL